MASNDDAVTALDLPAWGKNYGIKVLNSRDFNDRNRFISVVFDEAEAGIIGAVFAVAESGTLMLLVIIKVTYSPKYFLLQGP